jgi:hypothetical protein|tara:strand:+ start:1156 stop:1824 length:669 start_codon:yes stop_codon:yes gene_type:complete
MKTRIICLSTIVLIQIQSLSLNAQEKKVVTGTVTTFKVIPLNKVQITASKSGEVVYSDSLGTFSINCTEKDVIKIVASGFDSKKVRVKKIDNLKIDLIYSNTNTSFKAAIKNGYIREELLEEAIVKYPLKGQKDYSRYLTIYNLISGEIPTVKVSGTSVETMKSSSSAGGSLAVLYVVDGTIVDDLSYVVPLNVKSIRYLDGPAASRYGTRGGNGVLEIELK